MPSQSEFDDLVAEEVAAAKVATVDELAVERKEALTAVARARNMRVAKANARINDCARMLPGVYKDIAAVEARRKALDRRLASEEATGEKDRAAEAEKIRALEEEIAEAEESLDGLQQQRAQDEADLRKCRQAEEQEKKLLERADAEGRDLRRHQANLGAQLQKRRTENDAQLNRMMTQDQELATINFELERHSKARVAQEAKVTVSIEPITSRALSQKLGV